jgi:negative regulator of sigma E activity
VEPVKGQSRQGMINMLKRQVGDLQATVLGEAPWATVEAIATGLAPKQ